MLGRVLRAPVIGSLRLKLPPMERIRSEGCLDDGLQSLHVTKPRHGRSRNDPCSLLWPLICGKQTMSDKLVKKDEANYCKNNGMKGGFLSSIPSSLPLLFPSFFLPSTCLPLNSVAQYIPRNSTKHNIRRADSRQYEKTKTLSQIRLLHMKVHILQFCVTVLFSERLWMAISLLQWREPDFLMRSLHDMHEMNP